MSYKKEKIGGGGDKHYVYYRKSYRKSYSSAILRQRPVALLVRVGRSQVDVFGRQQEPMGDFYAADERSRAVTSVQKFNASEWNIALWRNFNISIAW